MHDDITDVCGIMVGHADDALGLTGCTVVLCEAGATGGVSVAGGAPGTRETDLLRSENMVQKVHAVLLAGGSAFGLDAAAGVMQYLESMGVGFSAGNVHVPIVPAAVIFDLGIGNAGIRPDALMGRHACENATGGPVAQGNVGAGMGATVGKMLGPKYMMKGGLGSASMRLPGGVTVGALVVVNALGDVCDPASGQILAGSRSPDGGFADAVALLTSREAPGSSGIENTTIGVIAVDLDLDKSETNKIAQMAHDGLARTVRPVHTMFDGDAVFAVATGTIPRTVDGLYSGPMGVTRIGVAAGEVMARAVLNAVGRARAVTGVPAMNDLKETQE